MKVYSLSVIGREHGELYAFASKREAERKKAELEKDEDYEMISDIQVQEFPISKTGVLAAYEMGASDVYK